MKSIRMRTLLLALIATAFAHASTWYDMQMGKMDNLSHLPVSEQIEILGSIVRIGHRGELNEEHKAVLKRSQSMLIAIPGHAEFYERKIKERQAMIHNSPKGQKSKYVPGYGMLQADCYQILSLMPSPETVRVLGDFLFDDEGGWNFDSGELPTTLTDEVLYPQPRNCDKASQALFQLIANPPVAGETQDYGANLPEWRLWYNQVKAGTRPIRFKGDPQEYSLSGPIRDGGHAELSRVPRRSPEGQVGTESDSDKSSSWSLPRIIAATLAFLVAGGYWAYRRKQKA